MTTAVQRILWAGIALLTLGASPSTVTLNHLQGKRGPVVFPHQAHVADYKGPGGASITCQQCHHALAADDTAATKCVTCHALPGLPIAMHGGTEPPRYAVEKKPGVFDIKTLVAHRQCFEGCHKQLPAAKAKPLKRCTACHRQ